MLYRDTLWNIPSLSQFYHVMHTLVQFVAMLCKMYQITHNEAFLSIFQPSLNQWQSWFSLYLIFSLTQRSLRPQSALVVSPLEWYHWSNHKILIIIMIDINIVKSYSAVPLFAPPRDGTKLLLSAEWNGAFLAGGLLMATYRVFCPIWYPSIFSTASDADFCTCTHITVPLSQVLTM